MTIDETLSAFLRTNSSITSLISSRVYPHRPPKNAVFPLVTFQRIGTLPVNSHDGYSGLAAADFFIKSWSPLLSVAQLVTRTIRLQIAGRNRLGDDSRVLIENEIHIDDPDAEIYQSILTVRIWHVENEI